MKTSLLRWSGIAALALFIGTGSTSAQTAFTVGDSVGVNTNTTYPTPFGDWYKTQRMQFLYPATELLDLGMGAGDITEIAWFCNAPVLAGDIPGLTEDYTIKMKSTATTDLGAAWEADATVVWGPANFTPTTSALNNFVLDAPFYWDGTSNIVIEICGGNSAGTYTDNGVVAYTTTAYNSSRTYRTDLSTAGGICNYTGAATTGTNPTRRPVTIFYGAVGDECTGTPDVSAAVSSDASVCADVLFNLSVDVITGFGISYQWQSSADGISYSDIAGATSASYDATQSEATYYQCVVTCAGSGESAASASVFVGMNVATDCYCTPTYTFFASGDYCSYVGLGSIDNPSGEDLDDNYEDFTYLSTDLVAGGAYTIQVTSGSYTSNNDFAVWIDYNANGSFYDAGELIGTYGDLGAFSSGFIDFTVPADATLGTTRMRVREIYAMPVSPDPCINYSFGETEDYSVNLIAEDLCPSPTDLVADAGVGSVSLSWGPVDVDKYRWSVYIDGDPTSKVSGQTFDSFQYISGLIPGATYTAKVRSVCYGVSTKSNDATTTFTVPLRQGLADQDIMIYPNPSNGSFRIQMNGFESSDVMVVITNAVGQVVYNNLMSVNDNINVSEINLSDVAAGTYTVKLINGNDVVTRSIVIE